MTIPTITMTMMGGQHSGKTMFLHAMYAMLSAGVDDLALMTVDPDQDTRMMRTWSGLKERGVRFAGTGAEPVEYRFQLLDGFDAIAELDVTDFRGAAMVAGEGADAALYRERLAQSDCIVITLNGWHLRTVVAGRDGPPSHTPKSAAFAEELRLISTNIRRAVRTRRDSGRPDPSMVLLITKADLLVGIPGTTFREALDVVERQLPTLVNVVESPGARALVCPVSVGNLGEEDDAFTPDAVQPRHMERPLIYALLRLLEADIARRTATLPPIPPAPPGQPATMGKALLRLVTDPIGNRAREAEQIHSEKTATRNEKIAVVRELMQLASRLRTRLSSMTVLVEGKRTEIP